MKLLWQQIPSSIITEIFCNSDYDGVVFDLEHGSFNNETLYSCIQVCDLLKKKSFVRVSYLDKQVVRMSLDANCSGVILSTVESVEEATEFKDYCTYPFKHHKESFSPDNKGIVRKSTIFETGGKRGQGLVRENAWGKKPLLFRKPILIPQIETVKGSQELRDIAALDFDYYLVGPYDLSASLGVAGDFENKAFTREVEHIKSIVGDKIGIHIPSNLEEEYSKYKDWEFVALGMDTIFLRDQVNKSYD
jgi:2-keto-3-deoxy-L-rhamnonate aldolase RhmA